MRGFTTYEAKTWMDINSPYITVFQYLGFRTARVMREMVNEQFVHLKSRLHYNVANKRIAILF